MDDATEVITDVVDAGSELVSGGRRFGVGQLILAGVIGAGVGGGLGYFLTRRQLETKFSQIADDEIAEMREHFRAKSVVADGKPELEEIVAKNGYGNEAPPIAIDPPTAVVEAAEAAREEEPKPEPPAKVRNIFEQAKEVDEPFEDTWDYHRERSRRSPEEPYVIHMDEREELDYDVMTLTYYEADDVICNERDEIVENRDELIGTTTLNKFGHGSDDADIVYVRNDKLELEFEVIKSPNSYAEEVHGFQHAERVHRMRRRARHDDE